jgi:signal transduction histidine kinase
MTDGGVRIAEAPGHPEGERSYATPAGVFVGGGELGALGRAKDWAATPLGPVGAWQASLKTAVGIVLTSDFPMIVLWGPELVQIYNDAYRMLMGEKHPAGLGQSNRECWPEVWHINEPIYGRVLAGETISFREALYPLAPHGVIEDFFLTLCYQPIRDDHGGVGGVFVTVFDVTSEVRTRQERDRALAEAQAERERLHEVFYRSPAFVATLRGTDHVFEMVNPPYVRLVGGRDVVGRPVREALPEVVGQGFIGLLDQVYRTGEPFVGTEVEILLQMGEDGPPATRYLNFVYQGLRDGAGAISGILAHGVDVTDQVLARREVEQKAAQLLRLTESLEQSNRDLDEFAYAASHDLKAPLRNIANLATWIEDDLDAEELAQVREHLALLRGRVERMDRLIDGILSYSRAGRHEAASQVDVGALLAELAEIHRLNDGVTISFPAAMPTLLGEPTPLQQVFMNLVSNAVKHTRAVRPDVQVCVSWRDAGDSYEFSVSDNGPGIAPEYQSRVWGLFQTLQSRDRVEGSGIGLAIVKKIVERRGGRVWVESHPGAGASFSFSWPK